MHTFAPEISTAMTIKERIIDQSTRMFISEGVKSVRMDDIAVQLSVSKRTIYELFGDKETLIGACLNHYFNFTEQELYERLAAAGNPIEQLLLVLDNWDTVITRNSTLIAGVKKFYPRVFNAIAAQRHNEGFRRLREMIERGVNGGYFLPAINLDMTVAVFTSAMYGIFSSTEHNCHLELPQPANLNDAVRYIMVHFFRGISTDKGIAIFDEYLEKNKK